MAIPTTFEAGTKFDIDLWHDRWNEKELKREHKADNRSFNRGFRQDAFSENERTFPAWERMLVKGVLLRDLLIPSRVGAYYGGMDIAGEKRPGTSLHTIAQLLDGHRVIVEIKNGAWTPNRMVAEAHASYMRWKHTLYKVENNGIQQAIVDMCVTSDVSFPVEGFLTASNKAHPELGLPGMQVELNNGGWMLLMDDPYDTGQPLKDHDQGCNCPYHLFITEVQQHPHFATTDTVMSWWFSREAARTAGLQIFAA
jgi:hypothetical protein